MFVEVGLLLDVLKPFNVHGMMTVFDFVSGHTWPASIAGKISLDNALKPNEGFKGSASEGLSLYPVIRSYLQHYRLLSHGSPDIVLATQSYLALALCLDELKKSMRGEASPDALASYIRTHLESFKVSYGEEHMIPKHHFTLHLPGCLRRDKLLLMLGMLYIEILLAMFMTMWCDCEVPQNSHVNSLLPAP